MTEWLIGLAAAVVALWLLLAYLALPLDLVPDVIPVIGWADDAILVAITIRSVLRHAPASLLEEHWPGDRHGLDSVLALVGRS